MLNVLRKNIRKIPLLVLIIIISGVPHAINMFGFPYYENDEGTYMSQAWSLIKFGKLAPYTYWYDHAPGGWILISIWIILTGGFFTFGTSVDSGRVLMLILHIATSLLLFYVARRLTGRTIPGILAVIVYSFSPLGIYFQRRVLLDNIMTFWIFLTLAVLLKKKLKLSQVVLSSLTAGIAILSKENAIFFVPALLYLLFTRLNKNQRTFGIILWVYGVFSVSSLYVLYALLQKEFFPQGFLGSSAEHVSLMETLKFHMGRGDNLPFWYQPVISMETCRNG